MQTFLPYRSYRASARSLDWRRLGKQRVEAYQLLRCLTGESTGWRNHPAAKMWRNHVPKLLAYTYVICNEWVNRGYRDTVAGKVADLAAQHGIEPDWTKPCWLDGDFMLTHRSNLVRKNPDHYAPQFGLLQEIPYLWPVQ